METAPQIQRVFIGIKVESGIAEKLADFVLPLSDPLIRSIPPADIHITLLPPWYTSDMYSMNKKLKNALHGRKRFSVAFERICYGPSMIRPWLIWAECAATEELTNLRRALLGAFEYEDKIPFHPHATIARIRGRDSLLPQKYPLEERLAFRQNVESIELFKSPHQGGTGYEILASIRLQSGLGMSH